MTDQTPAEVPIPSSTSQPLTDRVSNDPAEVLHRVFGYREFRGPQRAIIDQVLAGHNLLVLMPTGGGKSLCYQIPGLILPGVAVVVSPLIALMQDQVDALRQLGVRAGFLNSSLAPDRQQAVISALRNDELDLLYVAPERLLQPATMQLLRQVRPALFAIDEAHCVSQWGHDFRSDYLQLSVLQSTFPDVPRVALTATADVPTRQEIVERLGLDPDQQFVSGFDRPNIQYRITQKQNPRQQLLQFLRREHPRDAGIVYCLSRRKVEDTAAWLTGQGFTALPYHAGLSAELRQHHQQRFLREEGVIIVATIAFGMGIDKPDVRFIVHLDLPKSIEAYYQETGRAGRDGEPATAWMVYGLQDVIKLRQMMEESQGNETFKRSEQRKLDAMLGLCEITSCRRQALLEYFGEERSEPCGNCDACLNPAKTWDGTEAAQKALSCVYRTGQRFGVNHLIDVLHGSETEKVLQNNHHRLSTFGIGRELDRRDWQSVFRQLVARSFVNVDHSTYGGLYLNENARPVLRGGQSIDLRVDVRDSVLAGQGGKRRRLADELPEADLPLFQALKQCRKTLAEEFNVPSYVIFHDATLRDMVLYRPQTGSELLRINGVGQSKLDKYGAAFLSVINDSGPPD
ncbi:MAG: DNA helicase RecQ [Pseudohongiellaceae bacterium]